MSNQILKEYILKNDKLEVRFLNIGGAITKISLAEDNFDQNLVLAYDDPQDYLHNTIFLNTLIGRTSNRIKDGKFTLSGKDYQLDLNNAPNNLHGGADNLTHKAFDVTPIENGYELSTVLSHQEQGFPGNVSITVKYELLNDTLAVTYEAVTDKETIVNLTHHAYFNLSGNLAEDVKSQWVQIPSGAIAEVDETSAFTERILKTAGTRFDFNQSRPILLEGQTEGYDHLFLLDAKDPAAIFEEPKSGRKLIVRTTEPAMQFYSGIHMDDSLTFEKGKKGTPYLGACFETHQLPYDYEAQTLRPGETYCQKTTFQFLKK